jgi:hypothetical protein
MSKVEVRRHRGDQNPQSGTGLVFGEGSVRLISDGPVFGDKVRGQCTVLILHLLILTDVVLRWLNQQPLLDEFEF